MKPFDLEKAKAGASLITRDGKHRPTQFAVFHLKDIKKCWCVFDNKIYSFSASGDFDDAIKEHPLDLFLDEEITLRPWTQREGAKIVGAVIRHKISILDEPTLVVNSTREGLSIYYGTYTWKSLVSYEWKWPQEPDKPEFWKPCGVLG